MNSKGFTLLEILTAIFVFSIITVTVFSSFSAVLSSSNAIAEKSRYYETARACFQIITQDLSSIYLKQYPLYHPPDIDDTPDLHRLKGESESIGDGDFDRLMFASSNHISFVGNPRKGIARIVYYVHADDNDTLVLRRSDHLYPYPEFEESAEDPVLCRNILGLEFSFFDDAGEMHETWDSESEDLGFASPKVIGIKITIGNKENPLTFETKILLPVSRIKKETHV